MEDTQQLLQDILSIGDWATWQEAIDQVEGSLRSIRSITSQIKLKRVFLVGCGSSYYTAQVGKYIFEQIIGLPTEARQSFSFAHYSAPGMLTADTLVVGISTTGETQATCEAVSYAAQHGACTLALTSVPGSRLTQLARCALLAGENSRVVVKTRNYLQALLGVYWLAIHLAGDDPSLKERWLGQFRLACQITADFLRNQSPSISALVEKFRDAENIFILGSGPNYGTAEEAALKVIEMSKLYADGSEMEDFFHGRDREIVSKSPVFFLAPQGKPQPRMLDFLTFCKRNGVPSVVLSTREVPELGWLADHVIPLHGELDELATPLVYITPIYLFSYHLALARGFDPLVRRYPIPALRVYYRGSEFDPDAQECKNEI